MDNGKVGKAFPSMPVSRAITGKGSVGSTGKMPSTGVKGGQSKGSGTKS